MADKQVVIKVTDEGLKEVTKGIKELKKIIDQVNKTKVNVGSNVGGATEKIKENTGAVNKNKQGYDNLNKSQGEHYRHSQGTAQNTSNTTKAFSKQAQGLGGLIHVYATVAAHAFALSAAFNVLKSAAEVETVVKGLETMGAVSGANLPRMAKELQTVTGGALSLAESMRTVAFASSSGFSGKQITRLAAVARNAALTLGRDVPDAINRLTRGVAKLEPEILDELGLIVRLDDATKTYAASLGKSKEELTTFERSQAFLNETLKQGEDKFAAVQDALKPNAYAKLASAFGDITQRVLSLINAPLGKFLDYASENMEVLYTMLGLMTVYIGKHAIPIFKDFGKSMGTWADNAKSASESAKDLANIKVDALSEVSGRSVKDTEKGLAKSLSKVNLKFPSEKMAAQLADGMAGKKFTGHLKGELKKSMNRALKDMKKTGEKYSIQLGAKITKKQANQILKDLERVKVAHAHVAQSGQKNWKISLHRTSMHFAVWKAKSLSAIATVKAFAATAAAGMAKAFQKGLGWVTAIMTVFAIFKDQIMDLSDWMGITSEAERKLEEHTSTLTQAQEHLNKAAKVYGEITDNIGFTKQIQKYNALANITKEFSEATEDAVVSLEEYANSKNEALLDGEFDKQRTAIISMVESYQKLNNVAVNSALTKAVEESGIAINELGEASPEALVRFTKAFRQSSKEVSAGFSKIKANFEEGLEQISEFGKEAKNYLEAALPKTSLDAIAKITQTFGKNLRTAIEGKNKNAVKTFALSITDSQIALLGLNEEVIELAGNTGEGAALLDMYTAAEEKLLEVIKNEILQKQRLIEIEADLNTVRRYTKSSTTAINEELKLLKKKRDIELNGLIDELANRRKILKEIKKEGEEKERAKLAVKQTEIEIESLKQTQSDLVLEAAAFTKEVKIWDTQFKSLAELSQQRLDQSSDYLKNTEEQKNLLSDIEGIYGNQLVSLQTEIKLQKEYLKYRTDTLKGALDLSYKQDELEENRNNLDEKQLKIRIDMLHVDALALLKREQQFSYTKETLKLEEYQQKLRKSGAKDWLDQVKQARDAVDHKDPFSYLKGAEQAKTLQQAELERKKNLLTQLTHHQAIAKSLTRLLRLERERINNSQVMRAALYTQTKNYIEISKLVEEIEWPDPKDGAFQRIRDLVKEIRDDIEAIGEINTPHPAVISKANGGYISGPGGPKDDKIPAWLSNGEYVINAKAYKNNKELVEMINASSFANGGAADPGLFSILSMKENARKEMDRRWGRFGQQDPSYKASLDAQVSAGIHKNASRASINMGNVASHAILSAYLTRKFGSTESEFLTDYLEKAHSFWKGKYGLSDQINNKFGRDIALQNPNMSWNDLVKLIYNKVAQNTSGLDYADRNVQSWMGFAKGGAVTEDGKRVTKGFWPRTNPFFGDPKPMSNEEALEWINDTKIHHYKKTFDNVGFGNPFGDYSDSLGISKAWNMGVGEQQYRPRGWSDERLANFKNPGNRKWLQAEIRALASGGLASKGRNGDTELAHITPEESKLLKLFGGSGTINPKTGLMEFFQLFQPNNRRLEKLESNIQTFTNTIARQEEELERLRQRADTNEQVWMQPNLDQAVRDKEEAVKSLVAALSNLEARLKTATEASEKRENKNKLPGPGQDTGVSQTQEGTPSTGGFPPGEENNGTPGAAAMQNMEGKSKEDLADAIHERLKVIIPEIMQNAKKDLRPIVRQEVLGELLAAQDWDKGSETDNSDKTSKPTPASNLLLNNAEMVLDEGDIKIKALTEDIRVLEETLNGVNDGFANMGLILRDMGDTLSSNIVTGLGNTMTALDAHNASINKAQKASEDYDKNWYKSNKDIQKKTRDIFREKFNNEEKYWDEKGKITLKGEKKEQEYFSTLTREQRQQHKIQLDYTEGQKKADDELWQTKLHGASNMFTAMSGMFAEGSKEADKFAQVGKALTLVEQGLALATAVRAAADAAAKDVNPYTKLATALTVFAGLMSMIQSVGGGGPSGGSSKATPRVTRVESSGTLEDPTKKAESLKTALQNIEEIEIKTFEQGWDVLYALRSIDNSMKDLSTDIIKGIQAAGGQGNFSIGDMEDLFGTWFGTKVEPLKLWGIFGGGDSTTTELLGAGVQIMAQSLADVIDLTAGTYSDLSVKIWEKVKTTTVDAGWLGFGGGTSTSTSTIFKDFDNETEKSFAKTLFDISKAIVDIGEDLGYARNDLIDSLKDFEIAAQKIDLKELSPEEQATAIQSALSAIANDITLKIIPAVENWRKAGEEYLSALTRVYRDMLSFNRAFESIGTQLSDWFSKSGITDIIDWQQKILKSKKGGFKDIRDFSEAFGKFTESLYSKGELAKFALDNAKKRVSTGLDELGIAAGTSVEDFRTWYENKLGTGFFDDPDKLAIVIRLGEAFDDMTSSADDLEAAFSGVQELIDDMKFGDLSSLTDRDKYEHFKAEAEDLAKRAMAGDVAAGEQLSESMQKFIELSKSMFGGVGTFMTDRDWALQQLEDFKDKMGFAMGGIIAGGFKAFASGGIVNSATLGLVGEGRYNEAIVPLPDGNSIPVVQTGNNPVVVELAKFREQQAELMRSAVSINSQEGEELRETIEDLKSEVIELRNSTEGYNNSVERVATSFEYGRA